MKQKERFKVKKKGLTKKEKDFCRKYISTGDAAAAALEAGYKEKPCAVGPELLSREDITQEISRLCALKRQTAAEMSRVGYQRLAFGSIADAVSLLYMDKPSAQQIEKMDLFSVSEIKRKDDSVEIKFFDRLKALEKLSADSGDGAGAAPIYDAILRGASALSKSDSDEP